MNRILYNILDTIDQGIVILDDHYNILFWNTYMVRITGIKKEKMLNGDLYNKIPYFDTKFFRQTIAGTLNSGHKLFFSAAIHGNIFNNQKKLNIKVSRIEKESNQFLLLEFMDVTKEFVRINELKEDINQLHLLNCEMKEKERVIKNLAYYDELTGVANRTLFYKLADKFLAAAHKYHEIFGLMFIDVDRFKSINDTYGHIIGDKVLVKVARILKQAIRKSDVVVRYGGDEFLVLFPRLKTLEEIQIIASKIIYNKDKTVMYNDCPIDICFSIGISFYPYDGNNIDQLIAKADRAMYYEKCRYKNNI